MANSKNTINNIPLLGDLNLNTLKTDISPFTGYNEKNSTVFGGELSPIWTKETELGNKATTYTIFNSKGDRFEFRPYSTSSGHAVYKYYDFGKVVGDTFNSIRLVKYIPINVNLTSFLKENWDINEVTWAAAFSFSEFSRDANGFGIFFIKSSNKILYYVKSTALGATPVEIELVVPTGLHEYTDRNIISSPNPSDKSITFAGISTSTRYATCAYLKFDDSFNIKISESHISEFKVDNNSDSFLTIDSTGTIVSLVNTTKIQSPNSLTSIGYKFSYSTSSHWTNDGAVGSYYSANSVFHADIVTSWSTYHNRGFFNGVCNPFSATVCYPETNNGHSVHANVFGHASCTTGTDGNNFIPGYRSLYDSGRHDNVYTLDTNVVSLVSRGIPVTEPLSISNNFVSVEINDGCCFSYKKEDNNFYFSGMILAQDLVPSICKSLIIDNRYILCDDDTSDIIYDIENEELIKNSAYIGYIFTALPSLTGVSESLIASGDRPNKGAIFGGGYNAGFEINKARFTGYLANPFVMTNCYGDFWGWSEYIPAAVQSYCTISSTVQSAEYNGVDPMYSGTYYPVNSSANVVLPYNLQAKIISGYTNNDMILSSGTAYPLIYYNNTQKIYSYYLLSAMENVQNTFALQGQRYAVDENNIYSLSFEGGIISNVIAVAYKKNMQYLGALPTRAILYSSFNKTFYQFTGDAILSKLFEASDINEILFVNQNPSSLSLWISTDKGIYVFSDTDMFKLDYIAKDIYFIPEKALIITEDATNNIENEIALWKVDDGMTEVPIKLATKYYGLGSELKADYDCWYLRLHNKDHKAGKLKMKINTITDSTFQTEEKTEAIEPSRYDANDMIYIKFQPKYQSAVATQLELESDIAIYQISLGINQNDVVAQQSKFNF